MTNLSVIILVGKEAIHMQRCMEKLAPLEPRQVFVVESQPDDGTHAVAMATAESLGFRVQSSETVSSSEFSVQSSGENSKLETLSSKLNLVWHDWPGLYAKQFNWALDYIEGRSKSEEGRSVEDQPSSWILRLDADEYLTPETIEKLKAELPQVPEDVAGLTLELKRKFCGGEIRHATNGIRLLRIWRRGKGRSEERAMDEHIEVDGKVIDFDGAFYDDNLNDMDWWREKHRGYAKREAEWCRQWGLKNEFQIVDLKRFFNLGVVNRCRCRKDGEPLHVLYLGRRHPLKGVQYLEQAVKELNRHSTPTPNTYTTISLRIESSLFEEAKEAAWDWCDVLCLPTLSENFGLVVAESLEHGLPVITTDGAPAWAKLKPEQGSYIEGFRNGDETTRVKLFARANFQCNSTDFCVSA